MTSFLLCRFVPDAPMHLGEKEGVLEETFEYIRSDTLFSAICNAYLLLYGREELESLLEGFKLERPPFLISSAFPYAADVLFFPLPKNIDLSSYIGVKKAKRVELVSESIFRAALKGDVEDVIKKGYCLIQGERVLVTREEAERLRDHLGVRVAEEIRIWRKREVPRVALDRKTNASSIYYFGEVKFSESCGLFFLMKEGNGFKGVEKRVKAALRLLRDEGIGGDRTYGKGMFEDVRFDGISFECGRKDFFVTLSLYYPKREEISCLKDAFYDLVTRGGWIFSYSGVGMRRRSVRMLAEGSVVRFATTHEGGEDLLHGALVDVTPADFGWHRIYRYGYAFPIPLEVGGRERL